MAQTRTAASEQTWSIGARWFLFAAIAVPIAGYFTGAWYATPEVESFSRSPIVPQTLDQLGFFATTAAFMIAFGAIVSGIVTFAVVRVGKRFGSRATSLIAVFAPSWIAPAIAILGVIAYLVGFMAAGSSTEHACISLVTA